MVRITSLALRFRRFRQGQGWSLTDVQRRLHIHPMTWHKWERAEQTPPAAARALMFALQWAADNGELNNLVAEIEARGNWFGPVHIP